MNKLLRGKRILVTRPAAQAAQLTALIAGQGGEAICFPLLEIGPPDDSLPLQKAIERLDDYALAIFISPNAVDYSVPQILARHAWPTAWQVAAIGPGSAAQLASFGVGRVIAPLQRFDSEALLELPELQAENIAGKKVPLWPSSSSTKPSRPATIFVRRSSSDENKISSKGVKIETWISNPSSSFSLRGKKRGS